MIRTLEECLARYGPIIDGKWVNEPVWCMRIVVPTAISIRVVNTLTFQPWTHVYCNQDMAEPLEAAFATILSRGCLGELQTFDGCFSIRDVRGEPGHPSAHSYALAIDLNAKRNPLGGVSSWSDAFVKCFTDQGFSWGGNFSRRDPQHFSLAWE